MVDQDSPDDLRAQSQKVSAIFAPDPVGTNQLQIRLIGQCGGFQALPGSPPLKIVTGNAAQFRVHKIYQAIQCIRASVVPGGEEFRDIVLVLICHAGRNPSTKNQPFDSPFWKRFAELKSGGIL